MGRKSKPLIERIQNKIKKNKGHMVWVGAVNKRNVPGRIPKPKIYGGKDIRHKQVDVRRYLAQNFYGKKVKPHTYCYPKCGEPLCVNPEHMHFTNQYLVERSLGVDAVRDIKRRWALHLKHKVTMRELAEEHGCTRQNIEQIVNGLIKRGVSSV